MLAIHSQLRGNRGCFDAWFERIILVALLVVLLRTFLAVQGDGGLRALEVREEAEIERQRHPRIAHLQLVDTGSDRIGTVLENNMVVALSDLGFTNPSFSVNAFFIGTDVKSVKHGLNASPKPKPQDSRANVVA
jgi:hypothetical protein